MKKKLIILAGIMFLTAFLGVLCTGLFSKSRIGTNADIKIVTSFYPVYIAAKNITSGMDHIELVNLTENQSGCLHDYQLTTEDMKKLETADIFIMNGGGMEGFVTDAAESYSWLKVVDTSEGAHFIAEQEHIHKDDTDHDHGEYNSHIWLSTDDYLIQIKNMEHALAEYDKENQSRYEKNAVIYEDKILRLYGEWEKKLEDYKNKDVIIFHEAFAYTARELGMNVIHTANMDSETSLSAGEVAEIIDEIKQHNVKLLIADEQYGKAAAENIAEETGAKVVILDPLLSGSSENDSYLMEMRNNRKVLYKALQE